MGSGLGVCPVSSLGSRSPFSSVYRRQWGWLTCSLPEEIKELEEEGQESSRATESLEGLQNASFLPLGQEATGCP